ncbi:hypothetical protein [Delftia sp. ZNC0008]|uniref:hypothetical protein n=1 Tax=Delftia sp. ZNC0008 TaxID=1339242 RepID=UPI000AA4A4F1|nr:hypothetical protein [Delftia sp. ZNC0008]
MPSFKHNYAKLDNLILSLLRKYPTFAELFAQPEIRAETERLVSVEHARPGGNKSKDEWRFLDSRLQALRKSGEIEYQKVPSGWLLVDKKV